MNLYDVTRTAAAITDEIIVAYSGGKDSAIALDLCARHFRTVHAFFMYQVPGMSFQERTLKWAEARYGIEILRLPHWEVSEFLRWGTYHDEAPDVASVGIADVYAYVREQFGTYWIAAGERIADSIVRRAMILKSGTIDEKRGRVYPLAHWTVAHVRSYIRAHRLRVSEEARIFGYSFRDLKPKTLFLVRKHYPEDFERILAMYPEAEIAVKWWEEYGNK